MMATLLNQRHQQFQMAKTTTLLLLDWSTVDQLNLRNSCRDKTSPDCPFSETNRPGGAEISEIAPTEFWRRRENLRTKEQIGSPGLSVPDNQSETTHVETAPIPRLDEGSTPSSSTINADNQWIAQTTPSFTPRNVRLGVVIYLLV